MSVSRRGLLKCAATAVPAAAGLGALANAIAPVRASADSLGILLDYASGVLSGVDIKQGGPEQLNTTNVRSFGAVGDGVTDDTAAIHAARDASGVGGIVVFPLGTYLTTGLLAGNAYQVWNITSDATIRQSGAARATITVDAANVTITGGGTVDGGRVLLGDQPGNTTAVILGTLNSENLTVENIYVTEAPYYGIIGQGSHTRVLRCRFYRNYWAEIYLSSWVSMGPTRHDTYDNEIIGNYVDCTAENPATFNHTAINIRGDYAASGTQYYSYRGKIRDNTVILPAGCANTDGNACGIVLGFNAQNGLISGNTVVNGVLGISVPRSANCRVVGNTVFGGTLAAIELPNAPGAIVQGNVIDGQGTLGSLPSGCGIWIDHTGTTDVSIVGNRVFGINNAGRSISAGYTSRVTVTGNNFQSRYGITLNEMSDVTISNNTFLGDTIAYAVGLINSSSAVVSGNAIKNYNQGAQIYVSSGTSDYLNIIDNHFSGCTTAINTQLSDVGALGTNIVNEGNIVRAS